MRLEYPVDFVPPSLDADTPEEPSRRALYHKIFIGIVILMIFVLIIGRVL